MPPLVEARWFVNDLLDTTTHEALPYVKLALTVRRTGNPFVQQSKTVYDSF